MSLQTAYAGRWSEEHRRQQRIRWMARLSVREPPTHRRPTQRPPQATPGSEAETQSPRNLKAMSAMRTLALARKRWPWSLPLPTQAQARAATAERRRHGCLVSAVACPEAASEAAKATTENHAGPKPAQGQVVLSAASAGALGHAQALRQPPTQEQEEEEEEEKET